MKALCLIIHVQKPPMTMANYYFDYIPKINTKEQVPGICPQPNQLTVKIYIGIASAFLVFLQQITDYNFLYVSFSVTF